MIFNIPSNLNLSTIWNTFFITTGAIWPLPRLLCSPAFQQQMGHAQMPWWHCKHMGYRTMLSLQGNNTAKESLGLSNTTGYPAQLLPCCHLLLLSSPGALAPHQRVGLGCRIHAVRSSLSGESCAGTRGWWAQRGWKRENPALCSPAVQFVGRWTPLGIQPGSGHLVTGKKATPPPPMSHSKSQCLHSKV